MKVNLNYIKNHPTPLYWYDLDILKSTLAEIKRCVSGKPIKVHYAIKANHNPGLLREIASAGLGADCVSGGEITAALKAGFRPDSICYAGVGKTNSELLLGMESGIGFFNVESLEELRELDALAYSHGFKPKVCLRVNPDIDAHTHHYITTGIEENKFGIDMRLLDKAVDEAVNSKSLVLAGLHFHIGSQITIMEPFELLCRRINELVEKFREKGVEFEIINVGGGLGINYDNPEAVPVPDFKGYFDTLLSNLNLAPGQQLHCELGRAVVAQCGSLVSRVTYVKKGIGRNFVILDAGMNNLIRPALYGAYHKIENLSASAREATELYDVVGPVCESADTFGKDVLLPPTERGDIVVLRSAGAYGEAMASTYNCRPLAPSIIL